jgi:hypothetical protein
MQRQPEVARLGEVPSRDGRPEQETVCTPHPVFSRAAGGLGTGPSVGRGRKRARARGSVRRARGTTGADRALGFRPAFGLSRGRRAVLVVHKPGHGLDRVGQESEGGVAARVLDPKGSDDPGNRRRGPAPRPSQARE